MGLARGMRNGHRGVFKTQSLSPIHASEYSRLVLEFFHPVLDYDNGGGCLLARLDSRTTTKC